MTEPRRPLRGALIITALVAVFVGVAVWLVYSWFLFFECPFTSPAETPTCDDGPSWPHHAQFFVALLSSWAIARSAALAARWLNTGERDRRLVWHVGLATSVIAVWLLLFELAVS